MAYEGIDLRDLFRPESGLTIRRLIVLIRALPPDAPLRAAIADATEKANRAAPQTIRDRQAEFHRRNEAAKAKEAQ